MSTVSTQDRDVPVDKRAHRRDELARSALQTLGERGYARTSVRDIAANSPYSHGVLHYYFSDKTELIVHGIQLFKAECATRYDEVIADCATAGALSEGFGAKLAETLVQEAAMHRLWYDLRTQTLFPDRPEEGGGTSARLREAVTAIDRTLEGMIWRVVRRYAELSATRPLVPSELAYSLLDGVFEQSLRQHLNEDPDAPRVLSTRARNVLDMLVSRQDVQSTG